VNRPSRRWLPSLLLLSLIACRGSLAVAADGATDAVIDDGGEWTSGNSLYLEVSLNGVAAARLAHFDERHGELFVRATTLRQLGFALPADAADPIRLAALDGVTIDFDAQHQRVTIVAPLNLLDLKTERLNAPAQSAPKASSSPGILLNYDVYATGGDQANSVALSSEVRAFTGDLGVFSNTALSRYQQIAGTGWQGDSLRLDTNWQLAFPDSMLRLTVGDAITQSLAWTRATRIGGISIGTDFSLQPYRTTFPLPAFFGEATLPSAVDLYIDGIKQYSGKVAPGPFQLTTIPTINGIGNAQIVVTDAFGRSSTINMPLYATHQLLQEGLADWSANLGMVREGYGVSSFDYASDPMASGSLRYGVNNHFTVEGHAEATDGLSNAGAGGVFLLGTEGGIFSGSVARSAYRGDSGSQCSVGYNWSNRSFNFSVDSTRTSGAYRDVASLYGLAPPKTTDTAVAGFSVPAAGNFGINYLHQQYAGQPRSRYAGAFWSNTFGGNLSLSLGLNQNLDQASDRSIFASVTYTGNHRINYSASLQRNRGDTSMALEADQPVPGDGGFGWRALVRGGDSQNGGVAEADWLGERGQVTAGVNATGDTRYAYADATGSVVFMDGHVFTARHIDDAFAVVSTDGVANVPVKLENRPIGATDGDGMLLVTRLNAYQKNQLAIDPMSLPANVHVDSVDAIVTPSDRAGIVARFGMRTIRAAQVVLLDANGKPVPLGSSVRLDGQADSNALVGFDGVVYLDTLAQHNGLAVQTPSGICRVQFDYPASNADTIPEIGPLACRMESR
jgi:outer membrane usher protein